MSEGRRSGYAAGDVFHGMGFSWFKQGGARSMRKVSEWEGGRGSFLSLVPSLSEKWHNSLPNRKKKSVVGTVVSFQACELFLRHRGAIMKAGLKRLRLEGKTVLYVRQLCSIFFHNLLETAREFTKAFPANRSCNSGS